MLPRGRLTVVELVRFPQDSPIVGGGAPGGRHLRLPGLAEDMLEVLERLNRQFGKTIVMVTHDPRAAAHATVVVQLEKGKLQAAEQAGSTSRSPLPASR